MNRVHIATKHPLYTAIVLEDQTTDGRLVYRAEIPGLSGCMSHGESPEEALQNLEEAFELYMETIKARPESTSSVIVDLNVIVDLLSMPTTSGTSVVGALRRAVPVQIKSEIEDLEVR